MTETPLKASHRDAQIVFLESQIQIYKTRASLLHQERLLALNTLDEAVLRHQEELGQERSLRLVAQSRLRKVQSLLNATEKERDDCKDVVLQLIDKGAVERSHGDFKHWPYSKLHLSTRVEPLVERDITLDRTKTFHDSQASAYDEGLLYSLKHDLELERKAHAITRARVNVLSSQVATRDALLQEWVQNAAPSVHSGPIRNDSDDPLSNGNRETDINGNTHEIQQDFDASETTILYDKTIAHNKFLEQEINALIELLDQAQETVMLNPQQRDLPLPRSTSPAPLRDGPFRHQRQPPTSAFPLATPPRQHTRRPHTSPSPHRGRSKSTPHPAPSVSSLVSPLKRGSRTRSTSRPSPPGPSSSLHLPSVSENLIQDLNEQVQLLSREIDAFRAERTALAHVLQTQRDDTTMTERAGVPNDDIGEEPQDSSFDSYVTDGDYDQSLDVGVQTETEDGAESPPVHPHPPEDAHTPKEDAHVDGNVQGEGEADVTDGGERSMDIATPLISALVVFPDSSPAEDGGRIEQESEGNEEIKRITSPAEDIDQGDGQIKMIRPRRGPSASPPAP